MMTALDSRVSDANAEALGVSVRELMGNAGRAVASVLADRFPDARILFVCGTGNNGGDGFAAALEMEPEKVAVALLREPSKIKSNESRFYYSLLECPVFAYSPELLKNYDAIADCALGTGFSGCVKEPYSGFIDDANSSGLPILSVDVPSGMGSDKAIAPVCTVTFEDSKEGMGANCGEIVVAKIGIPKEAFSKVGPGDMLRYPIPKKESRKGNNGKLMVIGGGPYFGAPAMSCYAALRSGTDSVRLYSPESVHAEVRSVTPVLMVSDLPGDRLLPEHTDRLLSESAGYDAVLIGPGLGNAPDTLRAARSFVSSCRVPIVIDADAISAVAGMRFDVPAVLTPHAGEFKKLGFESPEDAAGSLGAVILLKGCEDTISDGKRTRRNASGTPAMTGAGTGDVLAGCVAGLVAKGMTAFDAACLGAYICGKAGELSFSEKSYGLIATDVAEMIPRVLKEGLE